MSDLPDNTRLLFVVNGLGIGGSERKTVTIVNALFAAGWDVHLAYLTSRTAGLDRLDPDVPLMYLGREGKFSMRALLNLRRYLRKERFHKIVCVNMYPLLYAYFAKLMYVRGTNAELLLLTNTTEFVGQKAKLQMIFYRPFLRAVERVVFGCEFQRDLWIGKYGIDVSRSQVVYNGVDEDRFSPDYECPNSVDAVQQIRAQSPTFVIGSIGQLRREKNHIELIEAFDRVKQAIPDALLVIVGEGPERGTLEERVRVSPYRDQILLLGQVSDVRPLLKSMDVFVLPSISETFSNAVLEAMAMGIVPIASGVGGGAEMIRHDHDGIIYRQGDIEVLLKHFVTLANNEDARATMARNARRSILEKFTFRKMIHDYEAVLGLRRGRARGLTGQ